MDNILFLVIAFLVGGAATIPIVVYIQKQKMMQARSTAEQILEAAEKEAESIKREKLVEAKDESLQIVQNAEKDARDKMREVREAERNLQSRELKIENKADLLDRKAQDLERLEQNLGTTRRELEESKSHYDKVLDAQNRKLEEIAGMSQEAAKQLLMDNMLEVARIEGSVRAKQIREEAILSATKEAKKIVIAAIQRSAADHTAESTVSVVELPNDQMKGRIIGREGRNIRTFEHLTGVELIVDDTPEAVVLSGFDPVRREIARVALTHLIEDGRIHPTRIEEMIEKATAEVEELMQAAAEEALNELQIAPPHPQIVKLIGRLKYRTSYGQNILKHSVEVGWLSGLMAAELGLDGLLARRAGFLHDIGKAIDRNTDGTHALIGGEVARKYNEPGEVVNAIESHHEEVEMTSPFSALVQAADAISGSRRGARGDTLESYIKRLRNLETIANGYDGVTKTYAIQAGRELRVMVESNHVDDIRASELSSQIAGRIESEMTYPGQIKVVVIRESRNVAFAR
ncbi:MAG: ribonuclease Y [Lentisphaeria bacterium]|nr:ribonuclease Y [Candidatus Neomarinimicrobiota bacterium]MCF7842683.1 ribonuclease Y [Lentisphaeria bacterium]